MTKLANKYDSEERAARFGEEIITFCKTSRGDVTIGTVINQIIRSATGIRANRCETGGAGSKTTPRNKNFLRRKEARETKHWLRVFAACYPGKNVPLGNFWPETRKFVLIFQKFPAPLRFEN